MQSRVLTGPPGQQALVSGQCLALSAYLSCHRDDPVAWARSVGVGQRRQRVKDLRSLQKSSVLLVPRNASGPGQSAHVSPYWAPSILRRENKKETVMSRQRWNQDRGYGAVSGDSLSRL